MRVLRILTRPNLGGPTRQAAALWHAHAALGVSTLLVVGSVGSDEGSLDLAAEGLPPVDRGAADLARRSGFCVVPGLGKGGGLLGGPSLRAELRRIMRAWRPDVVHTHTSKAGLWGRLAARSEGVPVLHTYHGHVFRDHLGWMQERLVVAVERWLARRTDRVLAISESCRDDLAAFGVAADAEVVAPAVPRQPLLDPETARRALDAPKDVPVVGFAGRLVPVKRPDLVVECARHRPGVRFLAFGDGPLREELARGAPSNLELRPGREDLPSLMRGFDVLLMPSRREGFPLTGVEALAAGVATVGFDVPGVRDLVREAGLGTAVPESEGVEGLVGALDVTLDGASNGAVDRAPDRALDRAPGGAESDAQGATRDGPAGLTARAERLLARCDPNAVAADLLSRYDSCGGST